MPKKSASIKKKRYLSNLLAGMSKKQAALKAGYSAATANTATQAIERSKSWEELLNEGIFKDENLLKVHKGLIKTKDKRVRLQALQEAYKIKGKHIERYSVGFKKEFEGIFDKD